MEKVKPRDGMANMSDLKSDGAQAPSGFDSRRGYALEELYYEIQTRGALKNENFIPLELYDSTSTSGMRQLMDSIRFWCGNIENIEVEVYDYSCKPHVYGKAGTFIKRIGRKRA